MMHEGLFSRYDHPDDVLQALTHREIWDWFAWYSKTPRGQRHSEVLHAMAVRDIRSAMHGQPEDAKAFLPQWHFDNEDAEPAEQTRGGRLLKNFGLRQRLEGM
jgi:hypothetical protein